MARYGSLGNYRLLFVPQTDGDWAISDRSAPTVTELTDTDVVDVSDYLLRNGLNTPLDGNTMPTASITERYNSQAAADYGGNPIRMDFFRDDEAGDDEDLAWDTFPFQTKGELVVFRQGTSGTDNAPDDGDRCEVWPIEVISRAMMDPEERQPDRFSVNASVPEAPEDDAVVATGS